MITNNKILATSLLLVAAVSSVFAEDDLNVFDEDLKKINDKKAIVGQY